MKKTRYIPMLENVKSGWWWRINARRYICTLLTKYITLDVNPDRRVVPATWCCEMHAFSWWHNGQVPLPEVHAGQAFFAIFYMWMTRCSGDVCLVDCGIIGFLIVILIQRVFCSWGFVWCELDARMCANKVEMIQLGLTSVLWYCMFGGSCVICRSFRLPICVHQKSNEPMITTNFIVIVYSVQLDCTSCFGLRVATKLVFWP